MTWQPSAVSTVDLLFHFRTSKNTGANHYMQAISTAHMTATWAIFMRNVNVPYATGF